MTVDQFIEKLESLNLKWRLDIRGEIQLDEYRDEEYSYTCPIVAVVGRKGCAWWNVFHLLELDREVARIIAQSADNYKFRFDPIIRRKLLKACKLETV